MDLKQIDMDRFLVWQSITLDLIWVLPQVQTIVGLGQVDAHLVFLDAAVEPMLSGDVNDPDYPVDSWKLSSNSILSHLWVLGSYEVLRTLDQAIGQDPSLVPAHIAAQVKQVHHEFRRVRVPLAKHKPANQHRTTDLGRPFNRIDPITGMEWQVGKDTIIRRRALSDRFLQVLRLLADHWREEKAGGIWAIKWEEPS